MLLRTTPDYFETLPTFHPRRRIKIPLLDVYKSSRPDFSDFLWLAMRQALRYRVLSLSLAGILKEFRRSETYWGRLFSHPAMTSL